MNRRPSAAAIVRVACLCALCLGALPAIAGGVTVTAGRTAAPPPGAGVMAGYLVVTNGGDQPVRITGARSDRFDRVELHRTREDDDMTSMIPVDAVEVAPGERLRFAPGGLHLMMFAPGPVPERGDRVALELITPAGPVPVTLDVVGPADVLQSGHGE